MVIDPYDESTDHEPQALASVGGARHQLYRDLPALPRSDGDSRLARRKPLINDVEPRRQCCCRVPSSGVIARCLSSRLTDTAHVGRGEEYRAGQTDSRPG